MKKVTLHGELAKIFKSVWFLHVKTPCEAINALMANEPDMKYFLSTKEQEGIYYAVGYEKEKPLVDKTEYDCLSEKDLHVFPVPAGGMAMAGQLLMTGAQQYASSFLNAKIERWKQKKLDKLNQADDGSPIIIQTKSYLAGGKDNRFQQGSVVPLGYGRMRLGSNVISSCNLNYEYDSVTNKIKNYAGGAIAGLAPAYMGNVYSSTVLSQSTSIGDELIHVEAVEDFDLGDDIDIDGVIFYVKQILTSENTLLLDREITERTFNAGTRVRNIDDPVIRSLDFDGAGPLGYEADGRNHTADGSLRFGAADSLYGDVLPAAAQAKESVTARYGDDWGGYLYYKYNWGKGIDKEKLNMEAGGNWRPLGLLETVGDGDESFRKSYVLGYNALNSSYVGLQSMPRQENSNNNLEPETKRFYPIIYSEGMGGATQVGQRWKRGKKTNGVGWYKLESVSIYKSIDLVCEGPIEGFCDKNGTTIEYTRGSSNDDFLQGVYLNDTPVKEKSNTIGNEFGGDVFYNVNEFDIDVASNDNVIGAGDQSLLKDHYLFTAHTKEVNQKLYGPRKANAADMIQGYTRTEFNNQNQLFSYGQFLEWSGVDKIDDDNDGVTDGYINVKRVGKFDGIISTGDLTTGDYRAIEKYEFGGGGTKGYGDPEYNQYLYPGDDSFEGLILTHDQGRYFTPYIGWDDDRAETINDYQYFSGEYVDLDAGKKYSAGTKVRTLADDGTINYVQMGVNADKFLGIYSDAEINKFNGRIGCVTMAATKNQAQGIATMQNSLYLITGYIDPVDAVQNQYGNRLTSFALQLIVLNPDVDDTMSTDPWFICTRAVDAVNKTVVTEQLKRIEGNGSLQFVNTIFSSNKDDVSPLVSPNLWDEVMIENPDYAWVRAHPDTPGATQKKSNNIDYIATMFGLTVDEKEIEEAEADRDPEAWREIVNDQNDLKKHKILGNLENSKTLDKFKIKRHNRVALIDSGPLASVLEGENVPRYNFERFFDLNKTANFPYSKMQDAVLYEIDGTVRGDYAQSEKVVYVKMSDPNSELSEDRTSTGDPNKGFYASMTFRTTGNDEYTWEKEDREIENYRIFNKTFTDEDGNSRTEILKEIVLKNPLSKTPIGGSAFKIVYKYKSSVKFKDKTTSQGFDVLEITDNVVAPSARNVNRKTLYFKLQKRARDPRHDFIALWVDAYDLTSVYNFTKLVNASTDHAGDYYHYVNVANHMFTKLSSNNLILTIQKEEEFYINHTVINPLVDRVYVGLQINQLYYTYAGDEVEITYKIGKMMALIFSIMTAINAAGIVGSFGVGFGVGAVAVSNFGWLLFLAVVALVVGWIVYIGLRSAKFKIGNRIDNSGELWPNRAKFRIKYGNVGEPLWSTDVYLYGVCTDGYRKDVKIFLPPNPKNKDRIVKVFKLNRERNPVIEGEQAARYKHDFSVYGFTEIIPTKLNYANSVVVGTRVNGRDMGGSLPTRNYHLKLKRVPVPSNYDADSRKYDGGWDGLFKGQTNLDDPIPDDKKVWTDNPAWCLYDLISDKAYGAGKFGIQLDHIDRWTLYKIAKYCDEFVPTGYSPKYKKKKFVASDAGDGSVVMTKGTGSEFSSDEDFLDQFGVRNGNLAVFYEDGTYDCLKISDYNTDYPYHDGGENYAIVFPGGFGVEKNGECALEIDYPLVEPRHTINAVLMEEQNAYTLINEFAEIFRAYTYWADGKIKFFQDEKKEPLMLFNNTNVSEDGFSYSNMPKTNRVNVSKVRYLDKYESYKPKLEMSQDREAINNNNVIEETKEGFGITSKSQAKRLTEFSLKSANLETEMVSFRTSLIGSYLRPGDVFQVLDSNRTIGRYAGKITSSKIDENSRFLYLYLDYPVDCDINPHDSTSWKDITIYDLSEFETIEALNLENKSKIEDDRIDNLRKSQLGKVKAIDISQGKEKVTIVDNTYEYIDGEFTFQTAIEDAINRGGQIASITSELDQYLAYLAFPKIPGKNAWIGGYINQNETYIWHAPKHDDPEIKYFNWKAGFPYKAAGDLSDLGLEDEPSYENYGNYISLYASETNTYHGKWILNRGDIKQGYILEKKSSNDKSSIFKFKNLKNKSFMIEDEVNMANAKTYSVLSMQEESNGIFKVTAKEYNKDKFDNIEKNLSIENPYVPVIWTDQIISDHPVNSSVEVESIEQEDETLKHYLVAKWNTVQPSGYFRITYFNGVEKISSFEISRVPNIENEYTHKIYLPEYTGKELFRVEVYLVN